MEKEEITNQQNSPDSRTSRENEEKFQANPRIPGKMMFLMTPIRISEGTKASKRTLFY
jgi:hypothetical protein